jgi:hypothetical protein
MEENIDADASFGQRLAIPNVADPESQPRVLERPAHGHLTGFAAGIYDDLGRIHRQQLLY